MSKNNTNYSMIRTAEKALDVLPSEEPLLTKVEEGTKKGVNSSFLEHDNLLTPQDALRRVKHQRNIGFRLGHEISGGRVPVVIDGEDPSVIPNEVIAWAEKYHRLKWSSLHGGHNWLIFATSDAYSRLSDAKSQIDLDGDGEHEIELLTENHAIAPGSIVEHTNCRSSKPCDGTGRGGYELLSTDDESPIPSKSDITELLVELEINPSEGSSSDSQTTNPGKLPKINDDYVAAGEANIREFQKYATGLAFNDLMDLLNGGTGSIDGLRHDDGTIDRDKADLEALWMLYGVMRHADESPERAKKLAFSVYTHYCKETPYMKDRTGRPRKWIDEREGSEYRKNRLKRSIEKHERDGTGWVRWMRRRRETASENSDDPLGFSGERSDLVYDAVMTALFTLTSVELSDPNLDTVLKGFAEIYNFILPEEYTIPSTPHPTGHKVCTPPDHRDVGGSDDTRTAPTAREVSALAHAIDPSREESTHREALRELQRDLGQVKRAYCPSRPNGLRYVYYPKTEPDPPDATEVVINGKEVNETV